MAGRGGNRRHDEYLGRTARLVKDFKKTIDQQNKSIQEAQTELKELEEEHQQHVKQRNNKLKDEIGTPQN